MKGFVQGADRQQTTLLPECLDDWVDEGNSIRAVKLNGTLERLTKSNSRVRPSRSRRTMVDHELANLTYQFAKSRRKTNEINNGFSGWRSLGELNPCFSLERPGALDLSVMCYFDDESRHSDTRYRAFC